MKTIEITVAENGSVRVETKGFTGASCRDGSAFIEKALGKQVNEILATEFYARENQRQRNVERG